jgi:hypothetical protein
VHSVASGAQNINTPFSCSGGSNSDLTGFGGHIVHSDASGV